MFKNLKTWYCIKTFFTFQKFQIFYSDLFCGNICNQAERSDGGAFASRWFKMPQETALSILYLALLSVRSMVKVEKRKVNIFNHYIYSTSVTSFKSVLSLT